MALFLALYFFIIILYTMRLLSQYPDRFCCYSQLYLNHLYYLYADDTIFSSFIYPIVITLSLM